MINRFGLVNKLTKSMSIIVFLFFNGEVFAMSIFSENVMFSEVVGVVTLNNVPVSNVEVEQYYRWSWDDKKEVDNITTNENGVFKFEKKLKRGGVSTLIPHEPVIFQQITIKYNGNEYIAWQYTKHNYEENGELKGKQINMMCELSNKPVEHEGYVGICTIKN